ncbi:MAG: 50S ribosomal protein L18 [Opitutales bacterium]
MKLQHKQRLRQNRIWRIRKKISGTAERPRLCVSFSNQHIYAQLIDDAAGRTIVSASSLDKSLREEKLGANRSGAEKLGQLIGEKAKEAGVVSVVFDRHGRPYHGRVQVFAEAARAAGLTF